MRRGGRRGWRRAAGRPSGSRSSIAASALLSSWRDPPLIAQAELTADRDLLQTRIAELPAPRGNAGLPQTLAEAWRLLQKPLSPSGERGWPEGAAEQEIVILTDRQHFGWADEATRRQWDAIGRQLRAESDRLEAAGAPTPRLRIVDVARDRTTPGPNLALGPLALSRALVPVAQGVKFTTTLHRTGSPRPPRGIRVAVDGVAAQHVPMPANIDEAAAQVPLSFTQRFDKPGLHVVAVTLEPAEPLDPPAADQVQHAVVEAVAELPVLLVDGDRHAAPESTTFFLDKALAGSGKHSVVVPRIVASTELTAAQILGATAAARQRVVVLADVPALPADAQAALATYLKDGGSVLVILGPRAERGTALYNEGFYRDGQGWLPARLGAVALRSAKPRHGRIRRAFSTRPWSCSAREWAT